MLWSKSLGKANAVGGVISRIPLSVLQNTRNWTKTKLNYNAFQRTAGNPQKCKSFYSTMTLYNAIGRENDII